MINSLSFPKWKYRKNTDTLPQPPLQVILWITFAKIAKYWRATVVFHFTERKRHKKMVRENSALQIMLRAGLGDSVQNTEKLCLFQVEKEREKSTLIPECYCSIMPSVLQHYRVDMHHWTKFVHLLEKKTLYLNSCGFATRLLRDHVRHPSALSSSRIHLSWCLSQRCEKKGINEPHLPSGSLLLPLQIVGMNLSLCTVLRQSKDMRINLHLDDHIEVFDMVFIVK